MQGKSYFSSLSKWVAGVVLTLSTTYANALLFQVDITADNSFSLYYGSEDGSSLAWVGSDYEWKTEHTYTFDLPNSYFIYVVTQSDLLVAQGFLGQFTNLENNTRFYTQDPQWQVTATGRYGAAPYDGSAASFLELATQLQLANQGNNPSNGWVAPTAGATNGTYPWTHNGSNIDSDARWIWYSSDGRTDPTLGGYNHDEYLIFRISVDAKEPTTTVPEPGTLALLGLGLFGLGMARRRRV